MSKCRATRAKCVKMTVCADGGAGSYADGGAGDKRR